MNMILHIGLGDRPWVEQAFQNISLDTCICISRKQQYLPTLSVKEYLWYEGHALDTVDWNVVRPLDEEVIESMRHCESVYLNMLSRTEGKSDVSYQERKREYLQCLRYWNHMFTEVGVDLFCSGEIPHFGFSYIPYSLCKLRGIPTFFFQNMRLVPDVLFLMEDWEDPTPALPSAYRKLKELHARRDIELPEAFEQYLRSQTEKSIDPTPWHMQGKSAFPANRRPPLTAPLLAPSKIPKNPLHFLLAVLLFLPRRFTPSYWRRHLQHFERTRRSRTMFRFYDSHTIIPDLTRKYVYLPLHMQPECSTAPMAGAYVDQILIVQMLNALLPKDVLLYVKEHPDQGKRSFDIGCRQLKFYEDLLACKKVRLVPRTFSTFDLIERAEAIATATGSPGFEALFRGKPVFMFGHRFFQHAPGVFPIHSTEDCRRAIHAIFEKNERPTLSDLRIFLKAIDTIAIPAATNPVDGQHSAKSPEENAQIVGEALRKRIEEKFGHLEKSEDAGSTSHERVIHKMLPQNMPRWRVSTHPPVLFS